MKHTDIGDILSTYAYLITGRRDIGPGKSVGSLPRAVRQQVLSLKSSDLSSLRPDTIFGPSAGKARPRHRKIIRGSTIVDRAKHAGLL